MFTSSVQFDSVRNSVFLLDRCTDTAIGFEFLQKILESDRSYCNTVYVIECHPIKVLTPLDITSVEFFAAEDPCFNAMNVMKKSTDTDPTIEMQLDSDSKLIGVIVRFFQHETKCLPNNMTYRLYGIDDDEVRIVLAQGLLSFK